MTTQIPTTPITPLPPAPPPNPPVTLGGTPNTSPPTVTRTGFASFSVNCPVTGARTCSVLGDLVAQSKRGFVTLAAVTGEVPFDHSQSFTLQLTRQGRKLLAHGLHGQAILRVTVDNQRLLTARLPVNRGTIKRIGSGG